MAVFRVEKTKDYTVMANHHLKSKDISLKAKGLLSVMLSLPDSWDYTLKGLSIINREGIDAIREAVRELERAGYIVRSRARNEMGHLKGTEYVIYEQPHLPDDPPASDFPTLENPTLDNPTQENPTQVSPTQVSPTQDLPTQENPTQLNIYRSNMYPEKPHISKPHVENPYQSNPYPSIPKASGSIDGEVSRMRAVVEANIDYDNIQSAYNADRLNEIVEIMVETLCSKSEKLNVGAESYPAELVKGRLLKINSLHIEYIFASMEKSARSIRNIKKYLLATLFNAPATMGNYYDAQVRQDLKEPSKAWLDSLWD